MMASIPEGYLGSDTLVRSGPAPELVKAGYMLEVADAPLLHRGFGLADLAHILTLHDLGIIPDDDVIRLLESLLDVMNIAPEDFPYDPLYGDAYNSREREFVNRVGKAAGWLHTGRTRREAGRIAFRLALRERLLDIHEAVNKFIDALVAQADDHATSVWADSTYLQPAQPSTFGHYLGSFAEEATRHLNRLESVYVWADTSPAGIGGVGGGRIHLDRSALSRRLGFSSIGAHTRDIMWATDGLVDVVTAATQAATTVDRLAEDFEIFTSPSLGYVTLDGSLCRASVLMPQKRNPYALAVIRSTAGTLIGRAAGLMVTQRTPSARTDNWLHAYGEVANSLDLAEDTIALGAEVVRTLQVNVESLEKSASKNFISSTDLAEELVQLLQIDYRTAYRVVGRAVAAAGDRESAQLTADDLKGGATDLVEDINTIDWNDIVSRGDPRLAVAARNILGGSSTESVRSHLARIRSISLEAVAWREGRRGIIADSQSALVREAESLRGPRTYRA